MECGELIVCEKWGTRLENEVPTIMGGVPMTDLGGGGGGGGWEACIVCF